MAVVWSHALAGHVDTRILDGQTFDSWDKIASKIGQEVGVFFEEEE